MLKHKKILRDRLAIISVAGAFAFTPLVISPVMAQTFGNESSEIYSTSDSDSNALDEQALDEQAPDETAVEENQVEPYSDKMAVEEPAPTVGNPIADEDSVPMDTDSLSSDMNSDSDTNSDDSLVRDENSDLPAGSEVDSITSASIPDSTGGSGIYVLEQSDNQVMANRYIGKAVYNDAMEKVGDIRDLVFTIDGGIEAAVIGVGGFLGLGQKQVAVRFEEIRIVENPETAELELYMSANAEQLAEAPEFTTREEKLAESRSQSLDADQPAVNPMAPTEPANPATPPVE